MSKITEMLEAAGKATPGPWKRYSKRAVYSPHESVVSGIMRDVVVAVLNDEERASLDADFCAASRNSIPDIQRIVEWIENSNVHARDCAAMNYERPFPCDCGASEIQSLIRR